MCCCKLHLHARWSNKAFVECCKLQKIGLHEITSYDTFFNHLTSSCLSDEVAYISLECCSDKKTLCNDIVKNGHNLKALADKSNSNVTIPLMYCEKQLHVTKKGKKTERLKAIKKNVNLEFLTAFTDKLLLKIVYHRNMLRHYRKTIKPLTDALNAVYMDIDFAKNLTVPVKYELQLLHWAQEQVTVHSGLIKVNGTKSYHPYFQTLKYMTTFLLKLQWMKCSAKSIT